MVIHCWTLICLSNRFHGGFRLFPDVWNKNKALFKRHENSVKSTNTLYGFNLYFDRFDEDLSVEVMTSLFATLWCVDRQRVQNHIVLVKLVHTLLHYDAISMLWLWRMHVYWDDYLHKYSNYLNTFNCWSAFKYCFLEYLNIHKYRIAIKLFEYLNFRRNPAVSMFCWDVTQATLLGKAIMFHSSHHGYGWDLWSDRSALCTNNIISSFIVDSVMNTNREKIYSFLHKTFQAIGWTICKRAISR